MYKSVNDFNVKTCKIIYIKRLRLWVEMRTVDRKSKAYCESLIAKPDETILSSGIKYCCGLKVDVCL